MKNAVWGFRGRKKKKTTDKLKKWSQSIFGFIILHDGSDPAFTIWKEICQLDSLGSVVTRRCVWVGVSSETPNSAANDEHVKNLMKRREGQIYFSGPFWRMSHDRGWHRPHVELQIYSGWKCGALLIRSLRVWQRCWGGCHSPRLIIQHALWRNTISLEPH